LRQRSSETDKRAPKQLLGGHFTQMMRLLQLSLLKVLDGGRRERHGEELLELPRYNLIGFQRAISRKQSESINKPDYDPYAQHREVDYVVDARDDVELPPTNLAGIPLDENPLAAHGAHQS
jgi:hypothetical protein